MANFYEDLINTFRPNKRFRILIIDPDEFLDSGNEFRHALKDSSPNPLAAQFGKPSLDQVKPGRSGVVFAFIQAFRALRCGAVIGKISAGFHMPRL